MHMAALRNDDTCAADATRTEPDCTVVMPGSEAGATQKPFALLQAEDCLPHLGRSAGAINVKPMHSSDFASYG